MFLIDDLAAIATIAAAGASIYTMATAPGAPTFPDGASSSRKVAEAQAAALPEQRRLAALEQQGGRGLRAGYTQMTGAEQRRLALQQQIADLKKKMGAGRDPMHQQYRDQLRQAQRDLEAIPPDATMVFLDKNGKLVPESEAMIDFAGSGTADVEGELARRYSDIQLDLGKKYGTQFAEEAAREIEQSDPQGAAARRMENEIIQNMIKSPPATSPLAGQLQGQIQDQVAAGSGLDAMSRAQLDAAVARANADRGGNISANDVAGAMSSGLEGRERLDAALAKGQAFLGSGQTPEDIEYRREQQNLANLSSFVGGRTPESQFSGLAGAGRGATPEYMGQPAPTMPGGAASAAGAYDVAAYNAQTRNLATQANPWMAGLSSLLTGIGSYANATKKP